MRPLIQSDGIVHVRACIVAAERYFWIPKGVIAVGGFAATKIDGLGGILIGDAQTAARTSALPTVNAQVLAAWASEQAKLLVESPLSDKEKHRIAGFVLQCGGDISRLPIIERGGDYLNIEALKSLLSDQDHAAVFEGAEVDYDEDKDSCHPRDFKDNFKPDPELFFLDNPPQPMATIDGKSWPSCIIEEDQRLSYDDIFRGVLTEIWGDFEEYTEDDAVVGTVGNYDEIQREVSVFNPSPAFETSHISEATPAPSGLS